MSDSEPASARPVRPVRYPWHDRLWAGLTRDLARLPHALLLHGAPGTGKRVLAARLAEVLLCAASDVGVRPCGRCRSCQLLDAGTHPDLLVVKPEGESNYVTVDQARAIGSFLALRPHTAAHKVVIVQPADAMNTNAANSLLKVLEEPPLGSILILVADQPARLPATIRSRCTRLLCSPPPTTEALQWLQEQGIAPNDACGLLAMAGGAPLLARELAQDGFLAQDRQLRADIVDLLEGRADPVACAGRWKTVGAERCLSWLHRWVSEEIKKCMGVGLTGASRKENTLRLRRLYDLFDAISEMQRILPGPLDELLVLEDVLIRWSRLGR